MNEIRINIDSCDSYHPPKIVITEDHKTLIDMPADEFASWLKRNLGLIPSPLPRNASSPSLPSDLGL